MHARSGQNTQHTEQTRTAAIAPSQQLQAFSIDGSLSRSIILSFCCQYFGFLLIFVIILMAIGIGVYAKKDSASIYMTEGWCAASTAIQADIQTYFQCCGLYWYNDSLARFDTETGIDVAAACSHITPDEKPRWCQAHSHSNRSRALGWDVCARTCAQCLPVLVCVSCVVPCPSNIGKDVGQPCLPILQSTFESSYIAAGACAIAFAVIMVRDTQHLPSYVEGFVHCVSIAHCASLCLVLFPGCWHDRCLRVDVRHQGEEASGGHSEAAS